MGLVETDSAATEIEERIAAYLTELTEGRDADRAADFYTADAHLVGPGMEMSREDLIELLRGVFKAGVQIEVDRQSMELFVHGDAAYEIAFADDMMVNPDGTEVPIRNNLFIRWERGGDGLWRFARVLMSPKEMPE